MDLIASISGFGGSIFYYLIPFLFVLTLVVFVHELGHFLVARWCGVAVEVFSVGFGREIFGFNDRHGTRWKLSWIPLGGYVKFLGDEGVASTPDREGLAEMDRSRRASAFHLKPLPQRAAVVAAGPIANFILAIVIFATVFTLFGRTITEPRVDQIQPDSAAVAAGFETGDLIVSINGSAIESFSDMQRIVSTSAGRELAIVVDRGGEPVTLTAIPDRREITDRFGNVHRVGLLGITREAGEDGVRVERSNPAEAVWLGTKETYFVIERTLDYVHGVIIGRESPDQLSGPIRIAQVSGQVASISLLALINLAAVLSVSIGLINLFPIPMLDGGHLMYYAIEGIRGRPLSERAQEFGFRVGLAIVLMLMVFATWNDLTQLRFL